MRGVLSYPTAVRSPLVFIARAIATLSVAFLLAGVIAPRMVNAHDTLQLLVALALYGLAAGVLAWGAYDLLAGLRRRRPSHLDQP